jgi:1-acyl-sn-glycerol-3-phosphate acyltransferase
LFWGRRSFAKKPGKIIIEFLPPLAPGMDRKTFMAELESRVEEASNRLIAEVSST